MDHNNDAIAAVAGAVTTIGTAAVALFSRFRAGHKLDQVLEMQVAQRSETASLRDEFRAAEAEKNQAMAVLREEVRAELRELSVQVSARQQDHGERLARVEERINWRDS